MRRPELSNRQWLYAGAGVVVAGAGIVFYRRVRSGRCGCAKRKQWLRDRNLWPQEVPDE